ncbi:MAG: MFS transporter [Chloroflexi bacterium]|nr:MFS transporter [Chloroflexota bacterium]
MSVCYITIVLFLSILSILLGTLIYLLPMLKIMRALRPKPISIYAGWWVISAPFLAAMLTVGSGQYAFGLLIEPLEQEFGWTRTQINLSLSFTAVGSFIAPYLGYIMDRHGAKNILVASMALIVVSYLLRPMMTELWHWYALSFIQYLGFSGASILPAGRLVGIWFQRSRGRVMGITLMGNNFGGMTFPYITTFALGLSWHWAFISLSPWQGTYLLFGVIGILMTIYALAVVREFPTREQIRSRGRDAAFSEGAADDAPVTLTGWSLREAVRTKAFYAIMIAMTLGTFTYTAVLTQVAAHLTEEGISPGVAASALSLLAGCGMCGKFFMGLLADRITARYALMVDLLGQAGFLVLLTLYAGVTVSLPMLWTGAELPLVWIVVGCFGFFLGAFGALTPLSVQDAFGVKFYGSIMGVMSITMGISSFLGPILAGWSFDTTGSYRIAFLLVAALFFTGAMSLILASNPKRSIAS